ncbi:MAG: hypothetical protein CVU04_02065 [Bacteroidetes bacterium HGW-Bacteroidetes-20]|nr:MAG: hypothetical protein CVU04_02065 [Bacteroidetes bacterium HGW-Bacteroidetes-20]
MKSIKELLILVLIFISFTYVDAQQNENFIYTPNKVFIFEANYDSCGVRTKNYIVMRILPEKTGKEYFIRYDYYSALPDYNHLDSLSSIDSSGFIETTTVLETSKYLFLHPPRVQYDRLTQYFPFPEVDFPIKVGKRYKRGFLSINDPKCNCLFWIKYKMYIDFYTQVKFKNKLIDVARIYGDGKNKTGFYSVLNLFSKEYGFVKMKYSISDSTTLEINLIEVIDKNEIVK